jgi:hypothetical protein
MYEKMIISSQQNSRPAESKTHMFPPNQASIQSTMNSSLNQTQATAAQALSQQHLFLQSQQNYNGQAASLLFPKINNVRNDGSGTLYKAAQGSFPP